MVFLSHYEGYLGNSPSRKMVGGKELKEVDFNLYFSPICTIKTFNPFNGVT
jgi:hypothetical protein